jgi:predicted N-acetyltransferase YhbS
MLIERIDEVRLAAADDAAIAALLTRAFGEAFGGNSFHQQRHHIRFVARDPDIIGHCALTYRAIRVAGEMVNIMGLAEVATDPGHRGRGIASALVQAAIAEAKLSPAPFLLLFGDAKLYAAAGFRPVRHKLRSVAMYWARTLRTQSRQSDSLMVLPLTDAQWPDVADIDMLGHLF